VNLHEDTILPVDNYGIFCEKEKLNNNADLASCLPCTHIPRSPIHTSTDKRAEQIWVYFATRRRTLVHFLSVTSSRWLAGSHQRPPTSMRSRVQQQQHPVPAPLRTIIKLTASRWRDVR